MTGGANDSLTNAVRVAQHGARLCPYPLTEHEAHIALVVWFITLGAVLVFMLAKVDWKNDPRLVWALLQKLVHRPLARLRHRGTEKHKSLKST